MRRLKEIFLEDKQFKLHSGLEPETIKNLEQARPSYEKILGRKFSLAEVYAIEVDQPSEEQEQQEVLRAKAREAAIKEIQRNDPSVTRKEALETLSSLGFD